MTNGERDDAVRRILQRAESMGERYFGRATPGVRHYGGAAMTWGDWADLADELGHLSDAVLVLREECLVQKRRLALAAMAEIDADKGKK
jgi:hypothetical protein